MLHNENNNAGSINPMLAQTIVANMNAKDIYISLYISTHSLGHQIVLAISPCHCHMT